MKHGCNKKFIYLVIIVCVLVFTLALSACNLFEAQLQAEYRGGDIPVGGELDRSQLFVEITDMTGTTRLGEGEYTLSGFDSSATGPKTVTVTYSKGNKTLTAVFTVNVVEEPEPDVILSSVSASYSGDDVVVGGTLDNSAITVTAAYSDGSSRIVEGGWTISGFDSSTAGAKTVTVTYSEGDISKTCTFTVNVVPQGTIPPVMELRSISAAYNGGDIVIGGTLDISAITVTATYGDGSSWIVVDGWTISGFDSSTAGAKTVTVTYVEGDISKTCTFTVNVVPQGTTPSVVELQSISAAYNGGDVIVNAQPNKVDFVVTAFYSDGNSKRVTDFTLEFDSSQAGQKPCKVIYSENGVERTATVNIMVVEVSQPGEPTEGEYNVDVIKNENLSMHFLMLGNKFTGDSVYIKAGETDILIDAGSRYNSASTIYNYVSQYCSDGILEYVVATHAHQDHIEAFVNGSNNGGGVLDRFKVENIIRFARKSTDSNISKLFMNKLDEMKKQGVNVFTAADCVNNANGAQKEYTLANGITMEILDQKYYHQNTSNENNYSVCLMIKQGENNYLFTGDLEDDGEASLAQLNSNLPKVKLWKGGHHGSYTAGNTALLTKIQPETVCICTCMGTTEYTSSGKHIFPAQEFVDRVAQYTDRVYCTSDGTKYKNSSSCLPANGNIVYACTNGQITMYFSNNNLKLKDTDWFKQNRTMPNAWRNS